MINSRFKTLLSFIAVFSLMFASLNTVTAKTPSGQADLEREKRMAVEVEDAVLDGEVIYLNETDQKGAKTKHKFMVIDTEPEAVTKGAVIILHGRGFHPNWEDTIFPLRTQLPAKGWRTLSVQMPVLEKAAKYYDYVPLFPLASQRITTSINYLKEKGVTNIVLLAHSCGAHMAMDWFKNNGDQAISAYIGVGMGATDYKQKMKQPFPLDKMNVPVLDIYGEKEYPAVIRMAPERLEAMNKAANKKSKQVVVSEANHYFTDQDDALVTEVATWLNSL